MMRTATVVLGLMLLFTAGGCGDPAGSSTPAPGSSSQNSDASKAAEHDASGGGELPRIDLAGIQELIQQTAAERRVLVIDFWATWCPPCVANFPAIHQAVEAAGDKARYVSVTFDAPGTDEQKAVAFLKKNHAMSDAYLALNEKQNDIVDGLGDKWTNVVVPAWFVFDAQGQLAGEYYDANELPAMLTQIRELTAK